mgnify:CR=1 FL=1
MKSEATDLCWYICKIAACFLLAPALSMSARGETNPLVGAWMFSKADFEGGAFQQPLAAVVTLMADGTYIANDTAEFVNGNIHGTTKGIWKKTGQNLAEATTINLGLSADKPNGFVGTFISTISFSYDSARDEVDGQILTTFYPEGTDPLATDSTDGIPFGVTNFSNGKRIQVDVNGEGGGQNLAGEIPVGPWFGTAVADDPATAAFPDIIFEPTFMDDGNVIYNDVQEEAQLYTAAHGKWVKTGENSFEAVVIRANLATTETTELESWIKIRFSGIIDPDNRDQLSGSLRMISFAPDADPLDPNDVGGESLGTFTVGALGRLRTFSAGQADADLSEDLAVGTWFGRAIPDDPALSPFPEVFMTPTFNGDGNFIANDAIATSLHHTAHGDWVKIDDTTLEATFLFIIGTPDPENPLGGLFRIKFTGIIDPDDPDKMTGKVEPMLFPPGTDPLNLESAEGIPVVGLTFPELRRVRAIPNPLVGAWMFSKAEFEGGAFQQPLAAVVTLMADGTYIANDTAEFVNGNIHGTTKGIWKKTGQNLAEATTINLGLSADKPNGFVGTFISTISFSYDSARDEVDGQILTTFYPEGTDPLATDSTDGIPFGVTNFSNGKRIQVDVNGEGGGQNLAGEIPVGPWFGTAVADDPATAAFPDIIFEPTFMDDGNVIYNDVQEEAQLYTAAHGKWVKTGENSFEAVVIRANLATTETTELESWIKIRFSGIIDPDNRDQLSGSLRMISFAPDADPLDPNDVGGESLGTFTVGALGRLRTFSAGQADADLSEDLAVGTWFGRAIPDDPALSPFPEVFMTPTFNGDGNFIANDAIATSLHHTAHGDWVKIDDTTLEATFLFIIGTPDPENPLGGLFRIKFTGIIDPDDPDKMTGKVEPMLFPPGTDPLNLESAEGIPVVGLTFPELRRVRAITYPKPIVASFDPSLNPQTGLFEQRVTVYNNTGAPVIGFQLNISDLPAGTVVSNANVEPDSIYFAGTLGDGESVELVVEYYSSSREGFHPELSIGAAAAVTPPTFDSGLAIERIFWDADGLVIEFPSKPGSTYYIQYSEDGMAWHTVLPAFQVSNTRTQWKDSGPPKTPVPPGLNSDRFYRVVEQ